MTFIEFLGFIITLVAMFFIFIKRFREERARRLNPKEFAEKERQKQMALKKFYRSLEGHMVDEEEEVEEHEEIEEEEHVHRPKIKKKRPPHPNLPMPQYVAPEMISKPYQSEGAADRQSQVKGERRQYRSDRLTTYEVVRQRRHSRGGKLIKEQTSLKDILILKEILDKPLAMRDPRD